MITIKDFRAAAFEKKCDLIVRNSDYITVRNCEDTNYYLYQVHGFFVEVIYSTITKRVKVIDAFNDLEKLDFYIEEISLAGLIT